MKLYLRFFLVLCLGFSSCKKENKKSKSNHIELDRNVEKDTIFSKLIIPDSLGVTGADGVISFPLSNGSSVFMMGDSFLAKVEDSKRNPDCKMINNTFIVLDKNKKESKAIFKGDFNDPETMLVPNQDNGKHEFYWPGHGYEYKNELHVFMSRFVHIDPVDGGWNFKYIGTDYLKLEKDTYNIISRDNFPYSNINGVHYGHSILKDGDYTYIYGTWHDKANANLHVARAQMNDTTNKLTHFEFFNGVSWSENPKDTQPLKGINKLTPEQFSVFKHNDKYVFVMQERGLFLGNIYSYVSDSPIGPWRNEKHLYHATEQENTKDEIFTYNAMAHPQYIQDNRLLVSYCVNSFNVPSIHEYISFYRPRFIWVPLEMILE
tara:strand:+ start:1210 stop:2337 length:1128 start_codon:yes stop_codon:yes gene_type:complete